MSQAASDTAELQIQHVSTFLIFGLSFFEQTARSMRFLDDVPGRRMPPEGPFEAASG